MAIEQLFCRNNVVDVSGTTVSPTTSGASGTEATGYEASNLLGGIPAKTWRSQNKTDEAVTIDLGSGNQNQFTFFALVNHNLSGGNIEIRSSSSNSLPTGGTTLTLHATISVPSDPLLHPVIFGALTTTTDHRYWFINFSVNSGGPAGTATSDDSYYEAGQIVLGDSETFNQRFQSPIEEEFFLENFEHRSLDGTVYRAKKATRRSLSLSWNSVNFTTKNQIEKLYRNVHGSFESFALCFNTDEPSTRPCYYGHFDGPLRISHQGEKYYNIRARFMEESMGEG